MLDWIGRGARAALLAALVVAPLGAHAQNKNESSDARDYLISVSRLYENLEYERALQQIERAKRITSGVETDVTLMLYEGVILADMNRMDEATGAFKAALYLRPDAKLPVKVSPKVEQHFEFVRTEVKRDLAPFLAGREAQRRQAEASAPREEKPSAPPPAPEARLAPPMTPEVSTARGSRSRALIPAIAGGVLLAAGGVSYGLARAEQSKLRGDDPGLVTREDARASASRGKTFQTVATGLAAAGVVGLGVAAGMYLLGGPSQPVALSLSTDGTSAFVSGSWR